MIGILAEVQRVQVGSLPAHNNPLCNAPHTQKGLVDDWQSPQSRVEAIIPTDATCAAKLLPDANLIHNVHGDRNFICSCRDVSAVVIPVDRGDGG